MARTAPQQSDGFADVVWAGYVLYSIPLVCALMSPPYCSKEAFAHSSWWGKPSLKRPCHFSVTSYLNCLHLEYPKSRFADIARPHMVSVVSTWYTLPYRGLVDERVQVKWVLFMRMSV